MAWKFKHGHGIRELEIQGEKLAGNVESVDEFKKEFLKMVQNQGFSRDDVYNADGSGLNWPALPRKFLASST